MCTFWIWGPKKSIVGEIGWSQFQLLPARNCWIATHLYHKPYHKITYLCKQYKQGLGHWSKDPKRIAMCCPSSSILSWSCSFFSSGEGPGRPRSLVRAGFAHPKVFVLKVAPGNPLAPETIWGNELPAQPQPCSGITYLKPMYSQSTSFFRFANVIPSHKDSSLSPSNKPCVQHIFPFGF